MHRGADSNGDHRETTPEGDDEPLVSCESCRKRKLKCTRQRPSCSNCNRLGTECVYEYKKIRPGVKSGAVESLNRRLEIIERALFVGSAASDLTPALSRPGNGGLLDVLSSLSHELNSLNSNINSGPPHQQTESRKRKRNDKSSDDDDSRPPEAHPATSESLECLSSSCPVVTEYVDELLRAYFSHVQPWIPMIHEATFRKRLQTRDGLQSQAVVLQAINMAALRFVKISDGELLPRAYVVAKTRASRRHVILHAMERISVENLQALIIVAHTDLGDGEPDSAWPIIGSLTRAVEYLQLSVEPGDRRTRVAFLRSLPSLSAPVEWVVEEERRRIFWNVFILDRFCSALTGWNTSLTAADVSRRLPVCGGHWRNVQPAGTAYFGIWDLSSAEIGKSISCLPSHYPGPASYASQETQNPSIAELHQPAQSCLPSPISLSNVGGFAYYVESVESLSRVTSHFLHQRVDFTNRAQLSGWLTRFKELDLRLILWKMYIPQHWKDSGVSRETVPGVMDPNLTVANTSHNVSMILLHQQIAYPGPELIGVQLPSAHSAETVQGAAIENATIIKKFLMGWPRDRPVRPQLGFCAFVSARILLVHWRYYDTQMAPEFWSLVQSLEEMSSRWTATSLDSTPQLNSMFLQFASRLRGLYEKCERDGEYHITTPGVDLADADNFWPGRLAATAADNSVSITAPYMQSSSEQHAPPSSEREDLVGAEGNVALSSEPEAIGQQPGDDSLTTMSQVLMDPRFMDMDRIISFSDMVFADDIDGIFDEGTSEWV